MKARAVYRLTVPVVCVMCALNLGVFVWVVVRLRSPVAYNVRVVEKPSFPVPPSFEPLPLPGQPSTNSPSPVVLPAPLPPVERFSLPYQYFEVGGVGAAFLNGRYLYPNSRHAYGVVRDIYPERIYLEGGSFIDNQRNQRSDYVSDSTGNSPPPQ